MGNASLHFLTDGSSFFAANSSLIQDLTIQIDPNVSGFLKLPDLLDMMSRFNIIIIIIIIISSILIIIIMLDMMIRIVMERNYDAQIEDAFR